MILGRFHSRGWLRTHGAGLSAAHWGSVADTGGMASPIDEQRKIVFVDVDGTIYDHEIIDQSAITAIRDARRRGCLVYICTGRAAGLVPQEIHDIGFDGEITNGGCDVWMNGELVYSQVMPRGGAARLVEYFESHDIPFALQT